ncbi:MAG TPA: 23S rRNA (uracil(1939)-C(5))-methyltransferase RlmD, partial [Gammaproteobacteria bacterium]|nr:23S rRNA (uracil(1939)-C(5))-methyltransferase RlmD [Gammaproteobacteria bacterium]
PTRSKRSYSLGTTEEILKASPERVSPACSVFGLCGGCALQHLDYRGQLAFKKDVVIEALRGVAVAVPTEILEVSARPWSYRRRARLGVRFVPKKGGVLVGFRERGKSFITPLATCPVMHKSVDRILPQLPGLITRLSSPDRIPQIEVAAGETGTALVFRHLTALTDDDLTLLRNFGAKESLFICTQAKGPDTTIPVSPEAVPDLFYRLETFNLKIRFSVTNFVQVNGTINERIVELVADWLKPGDRGDVLDLFCGLGNFALALAGEARQVLGIENDPALVKQARENALANGIENARFEVFDLFDESMADWQVRSYSRVLVDPPRSGAIEVLRVLMNTIKPDMIAYVSCNPATFVRDAAYLVGTGEYRLDKLAVADMFPHTSHVETCALFLRSD